MFRKAWSKSGSDDVIEGKACSVINTAVFIGQIGASLAMGPIVDTAGSGNYLMVIPCLAATVSFLIAVCVRMPTASQ